MVAGLCGPARHLAVGDTTWAVFLLALQERLPGASFVAASTLTRELRMRKEAGEVELLRRAGEAVDRVVARLDGTRFSGKTERAVVGGGGRHGGGGGPRDGHLQHRRPRAPTAPRRTTRRATG